MPRVRHRGHQLAAAGAERGAADEREGHVAAELGREREQLVVGGLGVPEPVEGEQGRGGVGRAAGHAAGDRDLLVDQEVGDRVPSDTGRHQRGGAGDDVVLADRDAVDVDVRRPVRDHAEHRVLGGDELVVQADGLVDGLEGVEAVLAGGADAEVQVDLGGGADVDAGRRQALGGHHPRPSLSRRLSSHGMPSAIRAKSSTPITSPRGRRVDAGVHERRLGGLAGAGERAQRRPQLLAALGEGRVDDREDLRRGWRSSPAGSRRVHATRPESTLGAGQKTLRPMEPARRTSANQAALTLRHAVGLGPGRRGEPVGDLGLHHHQPALEGGQQREHVEQHRHRDVVGQVGDQRGRRRSGDGLDPHGVGQHHLEARRPGPARGSAIVSGSRPASASSTSIATTRPATSSSASVSEPRPGPTSTTTSSRPTCDSRTIRRTVLGSMTKFWPRCLVGRRSSRAAS